MNSSNDITVANTGRLTDRSEIIIAKCSPECCGTRVGFVRFARSAIGRIRFDRALGGAHGRAVTHFLRAFDDHALTGGEARKYFDAAGPATADADFTARDLAIGDHVDVLALGLGREGFFGNDQRFAFVVREAHVQEHAGLERPVFVGQQCAHGHRPRVHVDARIDAGDGAGKTAPRERRRAGADRQTFAQ